MTVLGGDSGRTRSVSVRLFRANGGRMEVQTSLAKAAITMYTARVDGNTCAAARTSSRPKFLRPEERERYCPGLEDAITPEEAGFNLDFGNFDEINQVMRFGAKHNDIQRHLADMIRWKLRLPNRKALVELFELVEAKRNGGVEVAHFVDANAA